MVALSLICGLLIGTAAGTEELFLDGESIFSPHDFTILDGQLYVGVVGDEAVVVNTTTLSVEPAFEIDEPGNEVQDSGNDMVIHNGTLYLAAWSKDSRKIDMYAKNDQNKLINKVTDIDAGINFIISSMTSAENNLFFFVLGSTPSTFRIFDPNISSTKDFEVQELEIYPNPSQNIIYLEGDHQVEEVVILNATGDVIEIVKPTSDQSISISDLPSGRYILDLTTPR